MQAKSHHIPTGMPQNATGSRLSKGTVGITDRKGMPIPIAVRRKGDTWITSRLAASQVSPGLAFHARRQACLIDAARDRARQNIGGQRADPRHHEIR